MYANYRPYSSNDNFKFKERRCIVYIDLLQVVKALAVFKIVQTGCKVIDRWSDAYKEAVVAGVVKKGGEAE